TKKNTGMTWKSQVATHSTGDLPIALVERMTPFCHQISEMSQWPTTTTTMLAARRKSTYRSLVKGVALTRSSRPAAMAWQVCASAPPGVPQDGAEDQGGHPGVEEV